MSVASININKPPKGTITLPASKSISNRLLIMNALSEKSFSLINLSKSDDTILLQKLLKQILSSTPRKPLLLNAKNAGTVMRFLTAFLANRPGQWILDGDKRMYKRPIKPLVDALIKIGADISYLKQKGFPPIKINGKELRGGLIKLDSSMSSQYATALLLIAPCLPEGIKIDIGETVSRPYIEMTLALLKQAGIRYTKKKNLIEIKKQSFKTKKYFIEPDWSSAAFYYEIAALSANSAIQLKGLHKKSIQGDAILPSIFNKLGVKTTFTKDGVHISKSKTTADELTFDFINYPDLAPALIVCCAGLNIKATFSGLNHLAYKESNRLKALICELKKMKATIIYENNKITISPSKLNICHTINTYGDHRLAMVFAPLTIISKQPLLLKNPDVVSKSYPDFWKDLSSLGHKIVLS